MTKKYNMDIIYSGPLWANGIEAVGKMLRTRLELDEIPLSASQLVFSVFVEQMNNMLMYAEDYKPEGEERERADFPHKGMFVFGVKDNIYSLQTGNLMRSDRTSLIKDRIDILNTLATKGLRKYYMQTMRSEDDNIDSKGAGLGLIEIAKCANAPIEYEFIPVSEDLTFFSMLVTIG
jgi:hypothetical protein